jgi:hypothetical protein
MTRRTRKNSMKRSVKRRNSKKLYKQRGGTNFNEVQKSRLIVLGFTQAQVAQIEQLFGNVPDNYAMITIESEIQNKTPQAIIQSLIDANQEVENAAENEHFDPVYSPISVVPGNNGGKRRKSRKMRGHKQRGGARYGTGVGANNFDPNNSIYNTQELNLFPYKPN